METRRALSTTAGARPGLRLGRGADSGDHAAVRSLLSTLGIPNGGQRGWYLAVTVRAEEDVDGLSRGLSFVRLGRRPVAPLQLHAAHRRSDNSATFICGPATRPPNAVRLEGGGSATDPDRALESWRMQATAIRWGRAVRLHAFRGVEFRGRLVAGDSVTIALEIDLDMDDRLLDASEVVDAVGVVVRSHLE